ncbi:hypothetical protein D3C71_1272800 [compost metagenome]
MAIHGTVEARQWIERQGRTTTVEKSNTGIAGSDAAPPQGQQVGDMLGKQQSGVPVARVSSRVVDHGQPAQVAVARRDFITLAHRLQARAEQYVGGLDRALAQLLFIDATQVQRQGAAVQLVLAADQRAGLFHVLAGLGRGEVLADGFARQSVELLLEHILRRDYQGQTHDGLLG